MQSKRKIKPQMSDVRPAYEADALNCVGDDPHVGPHIVAKTYILGVAVDSETSPILHDSNFDIEKAIVDSQFEKQEQALENIRLAAQRQKEMEDALVAQRLAQEKEIELKRQQLLMEQRRNLEEFERKREWQRQEESRKIARKQALRAQELLEQRELRQKLFEEQLMQIAENERLRKEDLKKVAQERALREQELLEQREMRQKVIEREQLKIIEDERKLQEEAKKLAQEKTLCAREILQQNRQERIKREEELAEKIRFESSEKERKEKELKEKIEASIVAQRLQQEKERELKISQLEEQKQKWMENERKRQEEIRKNSQESTLRGQEFLEQKKTKQSNREELLAEQIKSEMLAKEKKEKELLIQRQKIEATILAEREALRIQQEQWLSRELEEEKNREQVDTYVARNKEESFSRKMIAIFKNAFPFSKMFLQFDLAKNAVPFGAFALTILLGIGIFSFIGKGISIKGQVLGASQNGYANISAAIDDMKKQNFEGSAQQFAQATQNFTEASENMKEVGGSLLDITRFIPIASKLSSGENAVEAGKHFSSAGQSLNEVAKVLVKLKNPLDQSGRKESASLLEIFQDAQKNIAEAKTELDEAQKNMGRISVDDLPEDKRDKFVLLKQQLPTIISALDMFLDNSHIFVDLLGGNGPRKYLFLFQNNSEMRATGGFVGSYGLLDISNGHVKKFFIDGIFNPDGQLQKKIVPPEPIQKISAAWSMHDSNWFPNFPTSAQKAVQFYEMTGGPTADGVISLTPTVMEKLLKITGPIDMPDYDVTLDSQNFVQLTQYEVEEDYDKKENKPKKILSDLAPLVLEKLLGSNDPQKIAATVEAFLAGLQEKHILLYSQNSDLEKIISAQGWSGEVLPSQKDFLSVINSNINGFKTDAVIEEKINHQAQLQADGSIVNTITITRHHAGGNSKYDWLNKVNADYMRVYVPKGSKLLEVSGQTRESNNPPLDYNALAFQRDEDVQKEEQGMVVDSATGTRIYEENDKTVFANWTYVSPQETMTITYKYVLPFRMFQVTTEGRKHIDSYSLVVQKQSGSVGSEFSSNVEYPKNYAVKWKFPIEAEDRDNKISDVSKLDIDRYVGIAFEKD